MNRFGLLFLAASAFLACKPADDEFDARDIRVCRDVAPQAPKSTAPVTTATRWLYQLQNASVTEIADTRFDLVTIDYSKDGSDEERYSAAELKTLQDNGTAALAYFSIGEAEDYRYYFNSAWLSEDGESGLDQPSGAAPCWLRLTNPDWEGNYKVQYWSEQWQTVVVDYLDRIIDAGFDGVYLDIIDAYEYWADDENGEGYVIEESVAAARMMNFVKRIAYHARVVRGVKNFLVLPQNGEGILAYDADGSYLHTISGIGIEDLYYDETEPIAASTTAARISFLRKIAAANRTVLVVDYVDDGSGYAGANKTRIDDFRAKALAEGYAPYAATYDRELDSPNFIAGVQE